MNPGVTGRGRSDRARKRRKQRRKTPTVGKAITVTSSLSFLSYAPGLEIRSRFSSRLPVLAPPTSGTLGRLSDVTRILNAVEAGDPHAAAELLPLVYDELRKLAAARMAAEAPGQTLQATALVHEA